MKRCIIIFYSFMLFLLASLPNLWAQQGNNDRKLRSRSLPDYRNVRIVNRTKKLKTYRSPKVDLGGRFFLQKGRYTFVSSGDGLSRRAKSFVVRGRRNVYWGKKTYRERPFTKDIAGRRLRTRRLHPRPNPRRPRVITAQARRVPATRRRNSYTYYGFSMQGLYARWNRRRLATSAKQKEKAWKGDVAQRPFRENRSVKYNTMPALPSSRLFIRGNTYAKTQNPMFMANIRKRRKQTYEIGPHFSGVVPIHKKPPRLTTLLGQKNKSVRTFSRYVKRRFGRKMLDMGSYAGLTPYKKKGAGANISLMANFRGTIRVSHKRNASAGSRHLSSTVPYRVNRVNSRTLRITKTVANFRGNIPLASLNRRVNKNLYNSSVVPYRVNRVKARHYYDYRRIVIKGKKIRFHPDVRFVHNSRGKATGERTIFDKLKLFWAKLFDTNEPPLDPRSKGRKPRYDNGEKDLWYR